VETGVGGGGSAQMQGLDAGWVDSPRQCFARRPSLLQAKKRVLKNIQALT
jgi:hypothetical protein